MVKSQGSTLDKLKKLADWKTEGDAGTPGVGVKSVDIGWNTKGEGRHLGSF